MTKYLEETHSIRTNIYETRRHLSATTNDIICGDHEYTCPNGVYVDINRKDSCSNDEVDSIPGYFKNIMHGIELAIESNDVRKLTTVLFSCWDDYEIHLETDPFSSMNAENPNGNKKIKYCFPMSATFPYRFPTWTYNISQSLRDTCGKVCECTDYSSYQLTFEYRARKYLGISRNRIDHFSDGLTVLIYLLSFIYIWDTNVLHAYCAFMHGGSLGFFLLGVWLFIGIIKCYSYTMSIAFNMSWEMIEYVIDFFLDSISPKSNISRKRYTSHGYFNVQKISNQIQEKYKNRIAIRIPIIHRLRNIIVQKAT